MPRSIELLYCRRYVWDYSIRIKDFEGLKANRRHDWRGRKHNINTKASTWCDVYSVCLWPLILQVVSNYLHHVAYIDLWYAASLLFLSEPRGTHTPPPSLSAALHALGSPFTAVLIHLSWLTSRVSSRTAECMNINTSQRFRWNTL